MTIMPEKLKKSILQTLAYFDIFSYPLTSEEIYRWLWCYNKNTDYTDLGIDYTDFLMGLERLKEVSWFGYKNGYYFLSGREEIVDSRQRAVRLLENKMKIARRGVKKIRWVPFVKVVFVCNTLASASATADSDIDVFIVIRNKRLWLARLLVTLTLSLFGLRRTKKSIKNKICLSFYVTEESLNLSPISIDEPDIYLAYWLDQLIPVYDPKDIRSKILQANKWARKYLPNAWQEYDLLRRWQAGEGEISKFIKNILEKMWGSGYGDLIEGQARDIQKAKMKRNTSSLQNENDNRVVISDQMLKFHENDRREFYRQMWEQRAEEYFR